MSENTKTPWAWCDHGVGEIVVYDPENDDAICVFDDDDAFWAWPDNYTTGGQAEANARHIVHCVNNHERLVEALRTADMALRWYKEGDQVAQARKIDELLSEIETGKGGE